MDAVCKLYIKNGTTLLVEGVEIYPESCEEIREYTWRKSVSINVLYKVNSSCNKDLLSYQIVEHTGKYDESEFKLSEDGLYGIKRIILPNAEYIAECSDLLPVYSDIYWYDAGVFFKNDSIVDIQEILNLEDEAEETTVLQTTQTTFLMHYIFKCYNEKLTLKLNNRLNKCKCKGSDCIDNPWTESEDEILWLFIAAIKFSLQCEDIYKAQWYLEQLTECNILCDNLKNTGCGCR